MTRIMELHKKILTYYCYELYITMVDCSSLNFDLTLGSFDDTLTFGSIDWYSLKFTKKSERSVEVFLGFLLLVHYFLPLLRCSVEIDSRKNNE